MILKKNLPRIYFLILFFVLIHPSSAQEVSFSKEVKLPEYVGQIDFSKNQDDFVLSFIEANEIGVVRCNPNMNEVASAFIAKEKQSYENFVGSYHLKDKVTYIFSNNTKKKFFGIVYDFEKSSWIEKLLDFQLDRDDYLTSFGYEGKFYLLSQIKNTRKLKFNILDIDLNHEIKIVNLDESSYLVNGKSKELPRKVFVGGTLKDSILDFGTNNGHLEVVKRFVPNLNKVVTYPNKIYVQNERFLITLDSNMDYTMLLQINLGNYETTIRRISKKDFGENDSNIKTNSFVLDNLLFLLKGNKKQVFLRLYDLDSNNVINNFSFHRNSPYYAERNILLNQKLIEVHNIEIQSPEDNNNYSIQKSLQKIMRGGNEIGIRVLDSDDSFLLMLGGYKKTNAAPMVMTPSGFGTTNITPFVFWNYSFVRDESLNFYLNKVNFELDISDFEDPYLEMENFLDTYFDKKIRRKINWETKFQIGSQYYLGYFNRNEKKYYIRKFN